MLSLFVVYILWEGSEIPMSILGLLFSFCLLVVNLLTLIFKISFYVRIVKRAFVHLTPNIFFQFYDSLFILGSVCHLHTEYFCFL